MARNYAAVPHEYLDEMAELSDEEFGRLMRALILYSSTGQEVQLAGNERYLYKRVIAQENRYQQNYDDLEEKRSEKAKRAAALRWNKENAQACSSNAKNAQACSSIPSNAKNANTETNTETNTIPTIVGDSVYNNAEKPRNTQKKFTPPSVDEVIKYCTERGNSVDAAHFVDYYTANGWHVGKQNMKDWKAAVRTWEHNGHYNGAKTQSRKTYEEIDYGSPEDFYR